MNDKSYESINKSPNINELIY